MKTICFTNNKGGVAKTVTAATVAVLLAKKKRVLFVDCDAQANGTELFNAKTDDGTIYDALNGKHCSPCPVRERLDVVPSENGLVAFEIEHAKDTRREQRLKEFLTQFADKYDFCIIDTPPQTGALVVSALVASDFVVIPTTPDAFAVAGLVHVLDVLDAVQKNLTASVRLAGIVLTQYDKRRVTAAAEQALRRAFGKDVFAAAIRSASVVRELVAENKTVADLKRKTAVADDFEAFTAELVRRTK